MIVVSYISLNQIYEFRFIFVDPLNYRMMQRLLVLATLPFVYSKIEVSGIRGSRYQRKTHRSCNSLFGNPCGALQKCVTDMSSEDGFRCDIDTSVERCDVFCGEGSTCVRDVETRKFECRCDYGFYKPDPYFDCTMINGFQSQM
jgi:hypothetical protein